MLRFSRVEIVFIAFGAVLGAIVSYALKAGLLAGAASIPPLLFVLLGLGLAEIVAGIATSRSPGSLIGMAARFIAFVAGVLLLLGGKIT